MGSQQLPGIPGFHDLSTGEHAGSTVVKVAMLPIRLRILIGKRAPFDNFFMANMRYRKMLMDILVSIVERAQGISTMIAHFKA